MKRRGIGLTLLLAAAAALSSCSFFNSFAVVNRSGAPVEVQYKLKEREAVEGTYRLDVRPAKKSGRDLEDHDREWRELGSEEFSFDERQGVVTVVLMPGEALRVHETSNYSADSEVHAEHFPLAGLRLSGERGTAQYVGEQARLQFGEPSGSIYTVTYY